MTNINTQTPKTQQTTIYVSYSVKTPTGTQLSVQRFTVRDIERMKRHLDRYAK